MIFEPSDKGIWNPIEPGMYDYEDTAGKLISDLENFEEWSKTQTIRIGAKRRAK